MNRPEVRIIEDQKEEIKPADISQNEKEMLLAKYGYATIPDNTIQEEPITNDLSFEEMCKVKEEELRINRMREIQKINGPKPITFDGDYYSNTNYDTDDSGFVFKVSIVSDMQIPK